MGRALLAARRGEDTDEALLGAMMEVQLHHQVTDFWRAYLKHRR